MDSECCLLSLSLDYLETLYLICADSLYVGLTWWTVLWTRLSGLWICLIVFPLNCVLVQTVFHRRGSSHMEDANTGCCHLDSPPALPFWKSPLHLLTSSATASAGNSLPTNILPPVSNTTDFLHGNPGFISCTRLFCFLSCSMNQRHLPIGRMNISGFTSVSCPCPHCLLASPLKFSLNTLKLLSQFQYFLWGPDFLSIHYIFIYPK